MSKLIGYDEHMNTWNEIAKEYLNYKITPNHEIIITPLLCPFWQTVQDAANKHYGNLHAKDWSIDKN